MKDWLWALHRQARVVGYGNVLFCIPIIISSARQLLEEVREFERKYPPTIALLKAKFAEEERLNRDRLAKVSRP